MAYTDIATQIGISPVLLYFVVIWETVWTGLAMWKSARKSHLIWFVVFFLVSLLGLPEIIYLWATRKKSKSGPKIKIKRK